MDEASWMQISVPVQSGNSGGPLLNMSGEVVGMTNWKADLGYVNLTKEIPQNVNWAVKSDFIIPLLPFEPDSNKSFNKTDNHSEIVSQVKKSICFIKDNDKKSQ